MPRAIVNSEDIGPYIATLSGLKGAEFPTDFLQKSTDGGVIRDPKVVQAYRGALERKMVHETLYQLFQSHLKDGAKGKAVQACGLEQIHEKHPLFGRLKGKAKDIVTNFSRKQYVHELFEPEQYRKCTYNFFYAFDQRKISDSFQKKMKKAATYLKEMATSYIDAKMVVPKPDAVQRFFDCMQDCQPSPEEKRREVSVDMRYLQGLFTTLDEVFQASRTGRGTAPEAPTTIVGPSSTAQRNRSR